MQSCVPIACFVHSEAHYVEAVVRLRGPQRLREASCLSMYRCLALEDGLTYLLLNLDCTSKLPWPFAGQDRRAQPYE